MEQTTAEHQRLLADIHRRLESAGLPPHARDWLVKALHPAASHRCPGIPDHSQALCVLPDFRDSAVITPPATITGSWDVCIVQTPGDASGDVGVGARRHGFYGTHSASVGCAWVDSRAAG